MNILRQRESKKEVKFNVERSQNIIVYANSKLITGVASILYQRLLLHSCVAKNNNTVSIS